MINKMVDENSVFDNYNLPDNWEIKTIGEVAVINSGGSAPQGDHYYFGEFPFVRVSHLSTDSFNIMNCDHITTEAIRKYKLKKFPKGTIVFPKSGASIYLEKRAIISEDSYIVSHLCTINAKSPKIDQMYLLYALKHHRFSADKSDGYPTLSLSEIRNTSIPLPPLPEQRAIANVLSTVRRAIDATERVIDAARELQRSMMKHLFNYGPVPVYEVDKVKLKETGIGELPMSWTHEKLGDVSEKPQYGYTETATFKKVGPHFLRITDIQNSGYVNWGEVPYCVCSEEDFQKYSLQKGDILVARIGATTGKSYIVFECPPSVFASYLIRIKPTRDLLLPSFLHQFMNTKFYWTQINARKGGRLKQGVNIPNLQELFVPLPEIHEQKTIVHILETLDEKIKNELTRKSLLETLFTSLLHHLMTGKLRVPYEQ